MTERKITILTISFVVIACLIFAYSEKSLRSTENQDWWTINFSDPKSRSLDFYIENHSNSTSFHWSVSAGKNKPIFEADETIKKEDKKFIKVKLEAPQNKEYTIRISADEKIKELSKDFN